MSESARGLIMVIRSFGNLAVNQRKDEMEDTLSPGLVFHPEIAPWPNIWSELRKCLAQRQFPLMVHERRRAVSTLANSIFSDLYENSRALDLEHKALNSGQTRTQYSDSHRNENATTGRMAYKISMRMKDEEKNFSGDIS